MNLLALLAVGAGGAFGSLARSLMTKALKQRMPSSFPYPTLLVNILSCLIAGCLMPLVLDDTLRLTMMTGFLGGFSTLSTMNFEALALFFSGRRAACFAYLGISYASTLGVATIGYLLVSLLTGTIA